MEYVEQPFLFDVSPRWTVTELTRHVRLLLEGDDELQGAWVEGEISNLSRPSSGHMYFTKKDSNASLRCVMWRNDAARARFLPKDGTAVEAHGNVSIYEAGGQYQLYVDVLQPLGEGALYQEFLRLKAKLEAEGLFDLERKRVLPESPRRIGIITSPTGAALRDILNTLRRRLPIVEVFLAPVPVQGDEAPAAIVQALRDLNEMVEPEVILLARGGGSIEDLWAFNDERVVRAITHSTAPVITGVGHETDFTLADFAADLRAPTPTAAAELATPITLLDLKGRLVEIGQILTSGVAGIVENRREALGWTESQLRFYSPARRLQTERQRLDEQNRRCQSARLHRQELAQERLNGLEAQLAALNPSAVLGRGYAVVMKKRKVVSSITQVKEGEALKVRVKDGEFDARVAGSDD